MAEEGEPIYDVLELEEELQVHRILLKSLGRARDEETENDWIRISKEIQRLEKLLERTKKQKEALRNATKPAQVLESEMEKSPNQSEHLSESPQRNLFRFSPLPTAPNFRHTRPETPPSQLSPSGFSPVSLPSRKRPGDFLLGQSSSKSRRTTPDGNSKSLEPSLSHSCASRRSVGTRDEPIDLTDYPSDAEVDSDWITNKVSAATSTPRTTSNAFLNGSTHKNGYGSVKQEQTPTPPGSDLWQPQNRAFDGFSHPKTEPNSAPSSEVAGSRSAHLETSRMPGSWAPSWELSRPPGVVVPVNGGPVPSSSNGGQFEPARTDQRPSSFPTRDSSLSNVIDRTKDFDPSRFKPEHGSHESQAFDLRAMRALHDPLFTDQNQRGGDLEKLLENILPDLDESDRDLGQTPAGLRGSLYPHQIQALAWMKKLEEGYNKGGILADDMGLGKTVSTISLILARHSGARIKTNLIVGPLSLLRQWEEELRSKIRESHRMSVFIYHSCKATTEDLLKYDVVLTTYNTLAAEWKRLQTYKQDNVDRRIDWRGGNLTAKFPLLHPDRAKFYRVILDESQFIKNMKTQASQAAQSLQSQYRWCLSGTPMMNGVQELYSPLVFLRIRPYNDWTAFRTAFGTLFGKRGNPRHEAMRSFQALIKAVMLRRKKDSQINGKAIIQLPPKTEHHIEVDLTKDERDFYNQLEHKAQVMFSKFNREGSIGKHYRIMLVRLLRMRQATCHPHLNLDVDDAANATNEQMEKRVRQLGPEAINRIKVQEDFDCPICHDVIEMPSFIYPCGHHGCNACIAAYVENKQADALHAGEEKSTGSYCPLCRKPFEVAELFSLTAFHKVHMPERMKQNEREALRDLNNDLSSDSDSDSDNEEFQDDSADDADADGNLKDFVVPDDYDEEHTRRRRTKRDPSIEFDFTDATTRRIRAKKPKPKFKWKDIKPSMLRELRAEGLKSRDARKKYMRYLKKTWEPSSKVTACLDLLQSIQPSGEKTIVFSQWTLLLDLVEVAMNLKGMTRPERYDGSMSHDLRDNAVKRFRESGHASVMLVGLKAGNAGLNLTAASRVVIMDPFWNPYIEMQAVDRTYRIGQQKSVKVYRILTKDTVEGRIMELQEKKKAMVESALDENASKSIARLGTTELMRLFRLT